MKGAMAFAVIVLAASNATAAPKKKGKKVVEPAPAAQVDTGAKRSVDGALEATLESTSTSTPTSTPTPSPSPSGTPIPSGTPTAAASETARERDVVETEPELDRSTGFALSLDAGLAMMSQRFHSNGESRAGRLTDYDFAAQGIAARVGARQVWAAGPVMRLGLVGVYRYAGATSIDAAGASLSLESHYADAAMSAGAYANVLGGLLFEARAGGAFMLNVTGIDDRAPLPSDRSIGSLLGARIAAPAIAHAGSRPVGIAIDAAHVGLLGVHDQTPGLEDGDRATSRAWTFGGEISVALLAPSSRTQLFAFVSGHAVVQDTRYEGTSSRNGASNGNVTAASRDASLIVSSLGARLAY